MIFSGRARPAHTPSSADSRDFKISLYSAGRWWRAEQLVFKATVSRWGARVSAIVKQLYRTKMWRRQMLGDLEDRFNSLEQGSRSMVAQVMFLF
jgi:hypothetical protein